MKIYYWICSQYNLSYLETSLCGWLLQIVIPHNYNIYIKISFNWVFRVQLNQCILLGLVSDHASSTQLIFYKHVHIFIFIKQFRLSSVVKNVLSFLWPATYLLPVKTPLSHLVFSSSVMNFFSYIYPITPLGLSQSLSLFLLEEKKQTNPSSILHLFTATIPSHYN